MLLVKRFLELAVILAVVVLFSACDGENERLARATVLHPGGRESYEQYNCIRCHNAGDGGYGPRMIDNPRLTEIIYIKGRIQNGKRIGGAQMPAFPNIKGEELEELAKFVRVLSQGSD
jgi:mono/diheme cytochrome c family protein